MSTTQLQIYLREVIPEFLHPFKPFSILNFAMKEDFGYVTCFPKVIVFFDDIFIIKKLVYNTPQVRCYHFFIVANIVESEFDTDVKTE